MLLRNCHMEITELKRCAGIGFAAKKMPGKCSFNHKWLTMKEYKWVRQVKGDSKKAICIVCNKTITLTTMGESALRSHMAGNKHQVNVKSNGTASTLKPFLQRKDSDNQKNICAATVNQEKDRTLSPNEDMPLYIPPPPATDAATSSGKSVSQSEVLWTLKTLTKFFALCFLIAKLLQNLLAGQEKHPISVFLVQQNTLRKC